MGVLTTTPDSLPLIKMIYMGYSGEGKSTSIVPLSIPDFREQEGFKLRWLDYDGKAEETIRSTLARMLHTKTITRAQHDAALANNDVCVCKEHSSIVNVLQGRQTVKAMGAEGKTTAWTNSIKQLAKWENSFSDKTILIPDSFTYAVRAMAAYSQEMNGKLNQALTFNDYQSPQAMAETFMVYCSEIDCHTIVCAHQDPLELYKDTGKKDDKGKPVQELIDTLVVPISVGKSGRMKLPARFNHMLMVSTEGSGAGARRYLYTQPNKGVVTKTPFYGRCAERYDMATGMVDYFKLRAGV